MLIHEIAGIDLKSLHTDVLRVLFLAVQDEWTVRKSEITSLKSMKRRLYQSSKNPRSRKRLSELSGLLSEDWSSVYPGSDGGSDCFYVYAHINPSTEMLNADPFTFKGIPIYIGKGNGDRAFDLKRNEGHGAEIRSMLKKGFGKDDIVQIVKSGLKESEAFELEAKLIYFFGTRFEARKNGLLVNIATPKTPY